MLVFINQFGCNLNIVECKVWTIIMCKLYKTML